MFLHIENNILNTDSIDSVRDITTYYKKTTLIEDEYEVCAFIIIMKTGEHIKIKDMDSDYADRFFVELSDRSMIYGSRKQTTNS